MIFKIIVQKLFKNGNKTLLVAWRWQELNQNTLCAFGPTISRSYGLSQSFFFFSCLLYYRSKVYNTRSWTHGWVKKEIEQEIFAPVFWVLGRLTQIASGYNTWIKPLNKIRMKRKIVGVANVTWQALIKSIKS